MPSWLKTSRAFWPLVTLPPLAVALRDAFAWEGVPFELEWIAPLVALLGFAACALALKRRREPLLPEQGDLWRLLGLGLLYSLTGNVCAFISPEHYFIAILMATGSLALLWGLLGRWSLVFWIPFMVLQQGQIAGLAIYGSRINSLVLAETFEASAEEASAYLTPANIGLIAASFVCVSFYGYFQWRVFRGVPRLRLAATGLLFALLAYFFGAFIPPYVQCRDFYWPFGEIANLAEAYDEAVTRNVATVQQVESLPSPADKPSSIATLQGGEGVVLVVHIGESVRADRMSVNGYERDTTPWLRARQQAGDLVSFTDCISAAADTCQAEIAILTNARRDIYATDPAYAPTTGSVLDLFVANHFTLYSFLGRRCSEKLKYDRVVHLLTRRSKERFNAPGDPWTAVPQMADVLRAHPGENLVFFINNEGSHTPFDHFDEDSAPFKPAETDFSNPAAHAREVNNAYDDTVHYTDEFFRRVAERLEGRPYLYVYVSDHGEYLGHDGIWGRGGLGSSKRDYHSTTGCRVGMFAIASPELLKLHPRFAEAMEQLRAHAGMCIGQEHVFHTLLGFFGIRTPYYDSRLDLANPGVQPYDGPKPETPEARPETPETSGETPAQPATSAAPHT